MNDIQNQLMYLAAWETLCRVAKTKAVDLQIISNLNRMNADSLMCDLLPIPEIA